MAREGTYGPHHSSGVGSGPGVGKIYGVLKRSSDGYVRDVVGNAWEAPVEANSGNYDITLTEDSTTRHYYFNAPSGITFDGTIITLIYTQIGANPSLNADTFEGFSIISRPDLVWGYVISSSLTAAQMLTIIESAIAGVTSGFSGQAGVRSFFSADGLKRRFYAALDALGNRVTITHDDLT